MIAGVSFDGGPDWEPGILADNSGHLYVVFIRSRI